MTNVALVDLKFIDGEPWDVARVAAQQAEAAIRLSLEAVEGLVWAARGSWLSQEHHRTGQMPDGETFDSAPLASYLRDIEESLQNALKRTNVVTHAAGHDPRSA